MASSRRRRNKKTALRIPAEREAVTSELPSCDKKFRRRRAMRDDVSASTTYWSRSTQAPANPYGSLRWHDDGLASEGWGAPPPLGRQRWRASMATSAGKTRGTLAWAATGERTSVSPRP
jgi:hypothetical protein